MAELTVNGRTTVRKLKTDFKKCFGSTLRVYKSVTCKGRMADDTETLAAIRTGDAKGGEFKVGGNTQVGNFEKKFAETFGIGVLVANADDSKLADKSVTLVQAGK